MSVLARCLLERMFLYIFMYFFWFKAQHEIEGKAEKLLQMPPVMEERQEINEVLEENKDIGHFSESSYVFTDISTSVCNRVRSALCG